VRGREKKGEREREGGGKARTKQIERRRGCRGGGPVSGSGGAPRGPTLTPALEDSGCAPSLRAGAELRWAVRPWPLHLHRPAALRGRGRRLGEPRRSSDFERAGKKGEGENRESERLDISVGWLSTILRLGFDGNG